MSNDYPPPAGDNNPQNPAGWNAPPSAQPGGYGAPPTPPYQSGGYLPGGNPGLPKPNNFLVWAILSTLLCCMPFGIVSIVYATKVDSLWTTGQQSAAEEAAAKAKKWAIVAMASGLALVVVYVLLIVVAGVLGADSSSSM